MNGDTGFIAGGAHVPVDAGTEAAVLTISPYCLPSLSMCSVAQG